MAINPEKVEAEFLAEEEYNANDPEQVNKARTKAGREKKAHLNFVRSILLTPDGRKWLYRLLAECEVFTISYSAAEDTRGAAFRDGKKFVGLQLFSDAKKADPKLFFMMIEECEQLKLPSLFPEKGLV